MSTRPITSAKALRGLRANSFAALVIVLAEYGLGIWVNLYGRLPASDHGASLAAGFARAVADGPVGLSIPAVLGAALLISAATALARSILVRRMTLIALTSVALLSVAAAALSGARFVGNGDNASSMSMAIAAGAAIGAYALVLLVTSSAPAEARS